MYMYKTLRVKLNERVVAFDDSLPLRALGPGKHRVWGSRLTELRFATDKLVFDTQPEVRAVIPSDWFAEAELSASERGVLFRDGVPAIYLRPGVHRYWTVDPSVELRIYDVTEPMPQLTEDLQCMIPGSEYVEVEVAEYQRGLLYVQGKLTRVLEPGKLSMWRYPEADARVDVIDMRSTQLTLAAQELMTRDKVTLRLSLSAEYAVADPRKTATALESVRDAVYLMVQLSARDYVASVTLDELLEGRDAMTQYLEARAMPKAAAFGIRIDSIGVKDVVLPGEMKALLNRVIEAEKEAAAGVILRREETAKTRALANTARVMADQPVLLRLKELEAMQEIAANIQEVRVVVGSDGLDKLVPAQLLSSSKGSA